MKKSNITTTNNTPAAKTNTSLATLSQEQIDIIKTQIAPGISNNDLDYCLEVAQKAQLNPIIKDIYFVPRSAKVNNNWVQKHEPMIGRRGARAIARRKGMIVPPNTGHTLKEFPMLVNGQWKMVTDLIGWAELIVEGVVVRKEAAYSVFAQKTKDGQVTQFWSKMPTVMVEKVAEFQLLDAVYGLDGILSIDAGLIDETMPTRTSSKLFDKEVEEAIKGLGLGFAEENGFAVLSGKVFENAKILKELGFIYENKQYKMALPSNEEEAIEAEIEEPTQQPQKLSPARELLNFLMEQGFTQEEVVSFVKDGLHSSSADIERMKTELLDKDALLEKARVFFTPPKQEEVEPSSADEVVEDDVSSLF